MQYPNKQQEKAARIILAAMEARIETLAKSAKSDENTNIYWCNGYQIIDVCAEHGAQNDGQEQKLIVQNMLLRHEITDKDANVVHQHFAGVELSDIRLHLHRYEYMRTEVMRTLKNTSFAYANYGTIKAIFERIRYM